ncbi:hypothetical protein [uncultured Sulfitobacter sp.]|uniref:DUF7697 family protein n=1 Tax=uncultured Sulfitobacter sp. TaxID=191468 RepID=UPI00262CFA61|nr:hypothetical protein [uncultured Sulfitobacter sp.]
MPRSIEGRAFIEASGTIYRQARIGMGGFEALDAEACLALLFARGIPQNIAALFIPYWEAGLIAAAEQRREKD